jgi:hypothetical protein
MIGDIDASDALGRLWLRWSQRLAHDMLTPAIVATGNLKLLRTQPDDKSRLEEQQKSLDRIDSLLTALRMCSYGTGISVAQLVASLAEIYPDKLIVRREGNLDVSNPSDHLGFILWLLLAAQHPSNGVARMDVTVTDSTGRIAIGPPGALDLGTWKEIDTNDAEKWWFLDAVEHLRVSGYAVEVRYKGDEWFILLTWSRLAGC